MRVGSLLGFVPGVVYNSFEKSAVVKDLDTKDDIHYIKLYDDYLIDFT